MAVATTSTASAFIRAVCAALVGIGWRHVEGAQSLREADIGAAAAGSVNFRPQGDLQAAEDTTRQASAVDSARLNWTLPIEARVYLGSRPPKPAEVNADLIEGALRALYAAKDVTRSAQALSLAAGKVVMDPTDRAHADVTLTLNATLTHDLRPGRTVDRLTP